MTTAIARIRKLIVYVVAVASGSATGVVLPAPWDVAVPAAIGIVLGVVHYFVPNAPAGPALPAGSLAAKAS